MAKKTGKKAQQRQSVRDAREQQRVDKENGIPTDLSKTQRRNYRLNLLKKIKSQFISAFPKSAQSQQMAGDTTPTTQTQKHRLQRSHALIRDKINKQDKQPAKSDDDFFERVHGFSDGVGAINAMEKQRRILDTERHQRRIATPDSDFPSYPALRRPIDSKDADKIKRDFLAGTTKSTPREREALELAMSRRR